MKKFLGSILLMAMLIIGNLPSNAQNNLIRNTEEVDGLVVSETIYKMEGDGLTNYMKRKSNSLSI